MSKSSTKHLFVWSPLVGSSSSMSRGKSKVGRNSLLTVPISPKIEDGADCLLHSFVASPGRYLEALFQRALEAIQDEDRIIILNPSALPAGPNVVSRISIIEQAIKKTRSDQRFGLRIWTLKGSNWPIAYEIALKQWADPGGLAFSLRHLTTADVRVDFAVLSKTYSLPVSTEWLSLDATDKLEVTPGFIIPDLGHVQFKQAIHLLSSLTHRGKAKSFNDPLYVMPYEAGDLLFFSLALKAMGILEPSILTLDHFSPIVKKILPRARLYRLRPQISESARKEMSEVAFFKQCVFPRIPADRSFIFLRPYRSVWPTNAHLIDQFKFALGFDFRNESQRSTIENQRVLEASVPRVTKSSTLRVLCHFDGGWKLKHYPQKWRDQLIRLLKKEGVNLTVLSQTEVPNARSVPFVSLSEYEKLLSKSDLVIGVDSFPIHYASLVSRLPILSIFGSTRSSCAHLPEKGSSVALERGIDCNPCGQIKVCPRYFGTICMNYPEPEAIVEQFKAMTNLGQVSTNQ